MYTCICGTCIMYHDVVKVIVLSAAELFIVVPSVQALLVIVWVSSPRCRWLGACAARGRRLVHVAVVTDASL